MPIPGPGDGPRPGGRRWVVADTGAWLLELEAAVTGARLEAKPISDGMPADTAEHGRGMALIQMIADSLTYRHDGSRNVWQVERSRRNRARDPG